MSLTLRPATYDDLPALLRIHSDCCQEITDRLGPGHWSLPPTYGHLRASLEGRAVFVVLLDGVAAGTVTTSPEPASFWLPTLWAEPGVRALSVYALAVRPPMQRRGIGTWAMGEVERMAREQGRRWVRLDAYVQNPRSVGFYRKLGYESRGEVSVNGVRLLCFEKPVQGAE